jgi:EmrB/QacA subfamily drug resistance transporter
MSPSQLSHTEEEKTPKTHPASDRLDPLVWRIAAVAVLGTLLSQLDATIVNVSLSTLAVDLRTDLATIQWVTSGYLLSLALVLPLSGWLVDRIGAKSLYLWCFSAFVLSSALCGLSWSAGSLILFRVVQGMSGGLLAPMTQLMMARSAGRHMARVMGIAAIPVLFAPILGPVIAGAILEHASWRWLFFVNLPVGLLAISLAVLILPDDRAETRRRELDLWGLGLLSPGLVLFLYGAEHFRERAGPGTMAVGLLLIAGFLMHACRKGNRALIDLSLLASKVFRVSAVTQFLANGVAFSGQMLIPFYLIRVCGQSPSAAGWSLAPLGVGMACSFPWLGPLTGRFGIRRVSAAGSLFGFLGTAILLWAVSHREAAILLPVALFLRGAGMGTVGIPSMTAAYSSVRREDLPMATTSLNIIQRLGGPTLTTLCATLLAWRTGDAAPGASSEAFVAGFGLLCVLHALVFLSALRLPLWITSADSPNSV